VSCRNSTGILLRDDDDQGYRRRCSVSAVGIRVDGVVVRLLVTGSNGMRGHDALVAAGIEPISDWAARWALAAPAVLAVG